jgi:hypothetical protein
MVRRGPLEKNIAPFLRSVAWMMPVTSKTTASAAVETGASGHREEKEDANRCSSSSHITLDDPSCKLIWHVEPTILALLRSIVLKGCGGCAAKKIVREKLKVQTTAGPFIELRII